MWTHLAARPDAAKIFGEAMQSLTHGAYGMLSAHYPFHNHRWTVDVGGGNWALLHPVLERNPNMRATVFDLPHVVEGARQRIAAAGLSDRCEAIGETRVSRYRQEQRPTF